MLLAGTGSALPQSTQPQPAPAPSVHRGTPSATDIINGLRPNGAPLATNTRGIRPAPTTDAAPSIDLTVPFATGSAALTRSAEQTLDALGRALTSSDLGGFRFRVEGHTDTVGKPEANLKLSQLRAEAVAAYLAEKFGVEAARLQPVGLGSGHLLVATPDQTPEPRNRMVRIVNLGR
jgi:OOP family OmpA-OmpF porin